MFPQKSDNHTWEAFLGRPRIASDASRVDSVHAGTTILLTGAGGSIGSALALRLAASGARRIILLESSEPNLYRVHRDLSGLAVGASHVPILGDISDRPLLDSIFSQYRPQMVYHAAAFKHVPLMEMNPLAAIRNNALGTYALAQAVAHHHAEKLIMISTDKAVDPASVMGVAKRLAELVLLAMGSETTPTHSIRLGNVLGSQGSVAELFLQQITRGGPLTVTHPEVRRYFLTLQETVGLVLTGAWLDSWAGIWVPELGPALKVLDLAEHLIRHAGLTPCADIPISFIGLRPGDKMTEQLVSSRESIEACTVGGLHRVASPQPPNADLKRALAELSDIALRRDLPNLIRAIHNVVPEYQPSSAMLKQTADSSTRMGGE